jgi:hypothetical protein
LKDLCESGLVWFTFQFGSVFVTYYNCMVHLQIVNGEAELAFVDSYQGVIFQLCSWAEG